MTKLIAARRGARRTLVTVAALSIALATCAFKPAEADTPTTGGPRSLLITYRSEPASRPAFRVYLQSEERAQLDKLKRAGVLESYQILFNPFVTSGTWDAMTVLTFTRYADTRRWREIERTAPGGLTPKGLRLAKPVDTYSADLSWGGGDPASAGGDSVYYVIPYEYSTADQYRKYVDGYVIPQVTGWIREGVLGSYRIFMNRSPVGPTWDALFILQYRDLEAFGRRDEIVAKVRQTLVGDPAWKALSDIKQTIRTESENTSAESLTP